MTIMKKIVPGLFILLIAFTAKVYAQAPELMNYQAVVRDAGGNTLAGGITVSLGFIIHDGTASGNVVFQENGSAVTNQFGLITYQIGTNGNLAIVDWGAGQKWLQVFIVPTGGNNYIDMGATQLISVPYALFAANSAPGPHGPTGPQGIQGATGPTGTPGVRGTTGATRK